jgi:hypothetical protein
MEASMTTTPPDQIPAERLQHLLDRQEILDCIHRCARGMDRHDADVIASAYHPDAYDDHGTFRGTAAEFIAHVNGSDASKGAHTAFLTHQHLVTNNVVNIDGNEAHSETYYLFIGQLRREATIQLCAGRYIDRFERRDGQWKIAARRVVMECLTQLKDPVDLSVEPYSRFTRGAWDRSDVSWERPLTVRPN